MVVHSSLTCGNIPHFHHAPLLSCSPHNTTLAMMQIGLELQYMTTYDRYVNSKLIKQSDVVDPVPRTIPANHQRIHDHLAWKIGDGKHGVGFTAGWMWGRFGDQLIGFMCTYKCGGVLKCGYFQIIHFGRIVHEINHPFWGSSSLGNLHIITREFWGQLLGFMKQVIHPLDQHEN